MGPAALRVQNCFVLYVAHRERERERERRGREGGGGTGSMPVACAACRIAAKYNELPVQGCAEERREEERGADRCDAREVHAAPEERMKEWIDFPSITPSSPPP